MKKVKIGFVGCGGIAGAHMARLSKIRGVELVAFCDTVKEKAAAAAGSYGGQFFTDFRLMLEKFSLDACFICVPPFAHGEMELLCVEKGIPFFVEKPVALDLETASKIDRAVEKRKLTTGVGYVLRAYDTVERGRAILSRERIGLVRGKYFGCVPGAGRGWYSQKSLSGGQLVEQATHTVDMMRYLAGDISEVFGYSFEGINRKLYEKYDVEDASTTVMRFASGVIGNLSCTWLWTGYYSGVEVICQNLILTLEGGCLTVDRGHTRTVYTSKLDPMLAQDTAFVEAVRKNNPHLVKASYREGLKSLAVSLSVLKSFQTGSPVKVPVP